MDSTGLSSNVTLKLQMGYFPWIHVLDEFNFRFMEKMLCVSSAEAAVIWILFVIELLVMCLALYGLWCLIKSDHPVPMFVINLFISDIIQICTRPFLQLCCFNLLIASILYTYIFSLISNIGFMICISLERYIMIKYPVWYRINNTLKKSLLICLLIWLFACVGLVVDFILLLKSRSKYAFVFNLIGFFWPFSLVVFCYVGTLNALARSISVPPDEQRRILRILALVIINYIVLFLPSVVNGVIFSVLFELEQEFLIDFLNTVAGILLYLTPLTDALLYVFMRKDALSVFRCLCCKMQSETQIESEMSRV